MKRPVVFIMFIFCLMLILSSQSNALTVTDIDGNVYHAVKIGDQWWTVENLKVTHYQNGDPIPNITTFAAWTGLSTGAQCTFNNNNGYIKTQGRLYNWFAVNDPRLIAPKGWRVPSSGDWEKLFTFLGGKAIAGGKLKEAGTAHWSSPNTGATNESGFTALPSGEVSTNFAGMGTYGFFWSSTSSNDLNARSYFLAHDGENVHNTDALKYFGFSVRLVSDNPPTPIQAAFYGTPVSGVVPFTVKFKNQSGGNIDDYFWEFGDGETNEWRSPSHIYSTVNLFDVKLKVSNACCSSERYIPNYILGIPYDPAIYHHCIFSEDFESTLSDLWSFLNSDHWEIKQNNNSIYINNTDYTGGLNDRLGEYALIDTVLDRNFTFQFDVKSLENYDVNGAVDYCGIFGFIDPDNYYYYMLNSSAHHTCIYKIDDGQRVLVQYRYGDWTHDNEYRTIKLVSEDNQLWVYQDSLAVFYLDNIDATGKVGIGSFNDASMYDNVSICLDIPVAQFTADTTFGSSPLTVQFIDSSRGVIDTYFWDFGDSDTSSVQNPVHTYAVPDTYSVSLHVSGSLGSDTEVKENYIIVVESASTTNQMTDVNDLNKAAFKFKLHANYPNPFNPRTLISFSIPKKSEVFISIYDINGRKIEQLVHQSYNAGQYDIHWNAENHPSGTYLIKLNTGQYQEIRKCLLLK